MSNAILNYSLQGTGRPLLILHGLFGSSQNWKSHGRELAADRAVYRVDLRNHGDSFHADSMDYASMAGDVERLMQDRQLEQADVLGHSMGGKVAMVLARQFPRRVGRLIVADIAPVTYAHEYDDVLLPLMRLDLEAVKSRSQAERMLEDDLPDRMLRQFLLQNLAISDGRASWRINLPALADAMPDITGFPDISDWRIETPSLFLRGANSPYVNADNWRIIQHYFSHARLQTLDNAGHWLHAEQPRPFLEAVRHFLA